jgi:hypothetical protein
LEAGGLDDCAAQQNTAASKSLCERMMSKIAVNQYSMLAFSEALFSSALARYHATSR